MDQWQSVPGENRKKVWTRLLELNRSNVDEFMSQMERTVLRQIKSVRVTPLHGLAVDCASIADAVTFVEVYSESAPAGPLVKYEVIIKYDNGDKIEGQFQDRLATIEFLAAYRSGNWKPSTQS